MHRRTLDILHDARGQYAMVMGSAENPLLTDDDRVDLRPVVRAFSVQQASFRLSRWWWAYHALRLGTAIVALAVPLAVLSVWLPASGTRWAAIAGYVVLGGVAALGHGVQQARNVRPAVFAAGCAVVALALGVLAGFTAISRYLWLWRGVGSGLVAAVALLALAEARLYGLLTLWTAVFRPLARRRGGGLLPAQMSAVRLLQLLDGLYRARATCRHPRRRASFLRWMDELIAYLRWELPAAVTDLRLGPAATADARTRAMRVVGRVRRWHVRLVHDHHLREYDRVCAEAAAVTMALARGDWSWVAADDDVPAGRKLVIRLAKRLAPAAVLGAAAIGLRYLPGVTASASGLTGIQVGLAVAAVLSLIPVEAAHRQDVMSAFASATGRR